MAAIISRLRPHNKITRSDLLTAGLGLVQTGLMFTLAQRYGLWPVAIGVVFAGALWPLRPGGAVPAGGWAKFLLGRVTQLLMGTSVVLIIALEPRLATQAAVAVLYFAWWMWYSTAKDQAKTSLVSLLLVQAAMFEAFFLMSAIWRTPSWAILGLVWLGAYLSVYAVLFWRGERAAGVIAATWAVIAAEISWVLLLWLFTYTMTGGYILVPQPVLILCGLAYCFGSIYLSQRRGTLSRARLTEYLLIGLILIVIVITGTSWKGSI